MKKASLIILLIILGSQAFAQVPGFMGKRIYMGYSFMYSPVLSPIPILYYHRINSGFVISRKLSIDIKYELSKYDNSNNATESNSFGLNIFIYRSGKCIAPVGFYKGIGIMYVMSNYYTYDQTTSESEKKKSYYGKDKMLVFSFTSGYKRTVLNTITFDLGFEFGLPFSISGNSYKDYLDIITEYGIRPYIGIGIIF